MSREKLVSQIEYMNGKLSDEYGQSVSCTYASLVLDGSGLKNITFNEMKSMFKNSNAGNVSYTMEKEWQAILR